MSDETAPITELLRLVNVGDAAAEARLLSLLYDELRRIAASCMSGERSDHTLQPTALVNEAYLRLVTQRDKTWQNRSHFLAVAAQVMRRVLVDYARARNSQKRAGQAMRVELDEALLFSRTGWEDRVIDIDNALGKLSDFDERMAKVIEFRYFAGMTETEIAKYLNVSDRTVKRDCKAARAWLQGELSPLEPGAAPDET
jgi:RNA polymerase sigma factor (TIGR02999 family)